ncbi:MAG: hypothetical protein ABI619_03100 [Betaproteobacteria bacterium]
MKLVGFEVGLDHPLFVIAGEYRSAEQGPLWGCDRGGAQKGPALMESI